MAEFTLKIITLEGVKFEDRVSGFTAQGIDGRFGVLVNHAPMVVALAPGRIEIDLNGKKDYYGASSGFCQITDREAILLVNKATYHGNRESVDEWVAETYGTKSKQTQEAG